MNATTLIVAVLVAAAGGLAYSLWRRAHQQSPSERERQRRLAVNASGRLTDGTLVESPHGLLPASDTRLLFFRYEVSGVEYTAAQDVSALLSESEAASLRSGTVAAVKYDPRKPSNSIVVCEQWSGLAEPPQTVQRHSKVSGT